MKSSLVFTYKGVMYNVEPSQNQDVIKEVVPSLDLHGYNT